MSKLHIGAYQFIWVLKREGYWAYIYLYYENNIATAMQKTNHHEHHNCFAYVNIFFMSTIQCSIVLICVQKPHTHVYTIDNFLWCQATGHSWLPGALQHTPHRTGIAGDSRALATHYFAGARTTVPRTSTLCAVPNPSFHLQCSPWLTQAWLTTIFPTVSAL